MKKIVLIIAALTLGVAANAQIVAGLQGGFYMRNDVNSRNADYSKVTHWLGGAQVGYMLTPKLYVGLSFGYLNMATDSLIARDSILIDERANTQYVGMWKTVEDHRFRSGRNGWMIAPMVRYEVVRYGNMCLNMLLQCSISSVGQATQKEGYRMPFDNNKEEDFDAWTDSTSYFSWNVSLRPTLTYEFSKHLNAELSLDFLSIGYSSESVKHENVAGYTDTRNVFYAGVNSFIRELRWEGPVFRLGFNYTF